MQTKLQDYRNKRFGCNNLYPPSQRHNKIHNTRLRVLTRRLSVDIWMHYFRNWSQFVAIANLRHKSKNIRDLVCKYAGYSTQLQQMKPRQSRLSNFVEKWLKSRCNKIKNSGIKLWKNGDLVCKIVTKNVTTGGCIYLHTRPQLHDKTICTHIRSTRQIRFDYFRSAK